MVLCSRERGARSRVSSSNSRSERRGSRKYALTIIPNVSLMPSFGAKVLWIGKLTAYDKQQQQYYYMIPRSARNRKHSK